MLSLDVKRTNITFQPYFLPYFRAKQEYQIYQATNSEATTIQSDTNVYVSVMLGQDL